MIKHGLILVSALAIAAPALAQSAERIDARISELDGRLDARVRSGALTTAEQQAIRDRLQAIIRRKQELSADGLTNKEAELLMANLDKIEAGIRTQSRDAQTSNTNTADSFGEFEARLSSMYARLDAGAADGSMTKAEVSGVRDNLDRLRDRVNRYKSDGTLSPDERRDLNTRFEVVSGGIARQRHDGQTR